VIQAKELNRPTSDQYQSQGLHRAQVFGYFLISSYASQKLVAVDKKVQAGRLRKQSSECRWQASSRRG
jgi:hypothetical protein